MISAAEPPELHPIIARPSGVEEEAPVSMASDHAVRQHDGCTWSARSVTAGGSFKVFGPLAGALAGTQRLLADATAVDALGGRHVVKL